MDDHLSREQCRELHGEAYVERFEHEQSPERLRRLIDFLDLNPTSNVADFGCGNGMVLEFLAARVGNYTGFDFSADFIAAARKRQRTLNATNASFECGSIVETCSKYLQAFDVGLALDISEHVYDDEWQELVDAMYSMLKPGGRLYLHTPNAEFLIEIMKSKNFLLRQFPEHIAVRNANENVQFVERAGFQNIVVQFLPHYNILRSFHILSYIPLIGKFFKARIFIDAVKGHA